MLNRKSLRFLLKPKIVAARPISIVGRSLDVQLIFRRTFIACALCCRKFIGCALFRRSFIGYTYHRTLIGCIRNRRMFIGCGTSVPFSPPLPSLFPSAMRVALSSPLPPRVQLASIERSLAEVTAIQRQLGIKVDEDEDEKDLEVDLVCRCSAGLLVHAPKAQ